MTIPALFVVVSVLSNPAAPRTPLFVFRSGFWNNLHHFLYVLGRARNGETDSRRAAVVNAPKDVEGLDGRPETDRSAWDEAVAFYAGGLSKKDAIFDDAMRATTRAIAELPEESDLSGLALDPRLVDTLRRVAPVYRAVWWPRHLSADAARQRDLEAMLDEHGTTAVRRLTALYGTTWPGRPRVINLTAYANWAGAYSTDGGLIEFASTSPAIAGAYGLETLLHESSHQWDAEIGARLARVAAAHDAKPPPDLSHMLIFYTSGEIVRELIPDHEPYAIRNGLWDRAGFRGMKSVLDEYWLPYIRGATSFDAAIAAILAHLPR